MEPGVLARYWHKLAGGKLVQCDLCPHRCRLAEDQLGLCGFRKNVAGEIFLLTYGLSSGCCIDPIEKKPLFHFLPGTAVLSFGTAGCNLACQCCQNWHLSRATVRDAELGKAPPDRIAYEARRLGCASVAFTYNEPVVFHEYAVDTAKECRKLGIRTVAVTSGYVNKEPRAEFYQWMDAANVDLKSFSPDFYKKYAGAELEPVLETLEYIKQKTSTWLEITTLLIPGLNDSQNEIHDLTHWIAKTLGPDVPLHFSAFYPSYKMKDRPPTPPKTLMTACYIAQKNGLRYVYAGNIRDPKGQSTFCHACREKIIGRDGYRITDWDLTSGGRCQCGSVCPGVFEEKPGSWDAKFFQVRLMDFTKM